MKNKLFSILAIVLCFALIAGAMTACSMKKKEEGTTLPGEEDWSQGSEEVYTPVDITDVELAAIVSEALGEEASGIDFDNFNMSSLTDEQIEKVKTVAEKRGYTVEEDSESGETVIKKDSNVKVSEVSSEKASEIASEAGIEETTHLSREQYEKVSKAAEENGVTAVTDEDGDLTIIATTHETTKATTKNPYTTGKDGKTTLPSQTKDSGGTSNSFTGSPQGTTLEKTEEINFANYGSYTNGSLCIFKNNVATSDGIIAVGNTMKASDGKTKSYTSGLIVKFSKDGAQVWTSILSADELTMLEDVAVLTDGSIIAVGETIATNLVSESEYKCKETAEAVIVKYAADGTRKWVKILGGSGGEEAYAVAATSDGGFVVGGNSTSHDADFKNAANYDENAFTAKFSADGTMQWMKTLGCSTFCGVQNIAVASSDTIYSVIEVTSSDGSFTKASPNDSTSTVLVKYDSTGKQIWTNYYYENAAVELFGITVANDDGVVLAGRYQAAKSANEYTFKGIYCGGSKGTYDGAVIKVNADGKNEWTLPLIGFDSDFVTGIAPIKGGYAITGYTTSSNRDFAMTNKGDYDSFVYAITEHGKLSVMTQIAGSDADKANSICSDGTNIYVCGQTLSDDGSFSKCANRSDGSNAAGFNFKFTLKQYK